MPANGHMESEEVEAVSVLKTGDKVTKVRRTRMDDLMAWLPVSQSK
jgi:hypothetical protein